LQTKALKLDVTFYCLKCYGMATSRTCPHDPQFQIAISGTRLREMLSNGIEVPPEFSRPEVVAILGEYYRSGRSGETGTAA
jgi:sulfate adenylyltransferase